MIIAHWIGIGLLVLNLLGFLFLVLCPAEEVPAPFDWDPDELELQQILIELERW